MMSEPTTPGDLLKVQNHYLAFTVTNTLLRAANLHGLLRVPDSCHIHEIINEPSFKDAVLTLQNSCLLLSETEEDEMSSLVSTLDITDSRLCSNFKQVSDRLMSDQIRFGRIASLFFFTYVLAKRLHLEGRRREVTSVVEWLAAVLDEKISSWLMEHHGGKWVSSGVNLSQGSHRQQEAATEYFGLFPIT